MGEGRVQKLAAREHGRLLGGKQFNTQPGFSSVQDIWETREEDVQIQCFLWAPRREREIHEVISDCEVLAVAQEGRCRKNHDLYEQKVFEMIPDVLFILDRPDKLRRPLEGPVEQDEIFKEALETLRKYELNVKKKIYLLGSYTPPKSPTLTKFSQMLKDGKNVTQVCKGSSFRQLKQCFRVFSMLTSVTLMECGGKNHLSKSENTS